MYLKSLQNQATITKKPVKETKTVEVPLTREEVSIERRRPSDGSGETEAQSPPLQSPEGDKNTIKKRSRGNKKAVC